MPRSPGVVPGAPPFPAGRVSSSASRLAVHRWAASAGWPGASRSAVTWRRSAPQCSCRLMVLAQLPGGLSPEVRPVRERGACPQAGQVSHSRTPWAVQAKVQPSRQASSHRPPSSARHDGQYRDRKSTRLNSSHVEISYAVFCLKKKKKKKNALTPEKKKKKKHKK